MNIQNVFHVILSFLNMKNGEEYVRQESEETFVRVHNTHYGTLSVVTVGRSVVCHLFVEA